LKCLDFNFPEPFLETDLAVAAHASREGTFIINHIYTYDDMPEVPRGEGPSLGEAITLEGNNNQKPTAIQGWGNL